MLSRLTGGCGDCVCLWKHALPPLPTVFPEHRWAVTLVVVISRLLCAAALVILASCSRPEASSVAAKSPDVATVRVAKADVENLAHDIVLTAEFRPYQEVDVMAKVAGYIREIKVDAGDRVREGQLLATLEIPEMADDQRRAQAAIDRSQAEVARAQDELKRVQETQNIAHVTSERLIGVSKQRPGLIAQQELDDVKSRDLSAQAQVAAARSSLIAAEQQVRVNSSDLERVKTMFEYTRVTAPFAGVITKRYADKGSMIQAGTASNTQASPVVRLSENSLLRLILPVPESAVSTVHIGQRVEVAGPDDEAYFSGQSRAIFRQAGGGDAHHGHRSGCRRIPTCC